MCRLSCQFLVISLFFMFLHNAIYSLSSSSTPSKAALCSPDQSFALLHFKNSFLISNTSEIVIGGGGFGPTYQVCNGDPRTEYWKEGSDCCSWRGVTCDRLTGYVTGLDVSCSGLVGPLYPNSTLFHLRHLRKLNLAYNEFTGSEISPMFGHFTRLTHLNLSFSNFKGWVPPEISHLSNLVSLDLSTGVYFSTRGVFTSAIFEYSNVRLHQQSFDRLSQNLTNLRVLVLDFVDLSSIAPCSLVNLSSSLISLHLKGCKLQGKFPNDVLRFPFLEKLDLSLNGPFIGHLPKSNWSSPLRLLDFSDSALCGDTIDEKIDLPDAIGELRTLNVLNLACVFKESKDCGFKGLIPKALFNLTRLTSLDSSGSGFSGYIPASISKLDKLTDLYLARNEFSGQLPSSVFNLTQLSYMYLSRNQLEGHFPSQVRGLSHLIELDLSGNLLSGRIPSWLLALPSLQYLDLTNNTLTGPIDPFEQPGPVQYVNLANNKIHGSIPDSMFELVNVSKLDLSSNNLSGTVNADLFSKLIILESVDFSRNRDLSLRSYSSFNFSLPNLISFLFSSCNQTEFPVFLRNLKNLTTLDLSDNKITGQISQEELGLWQDLVHLNLSHNFLTRLVQFPLVKFSILDLHSNLLQGPLAVPPPVGITGFFSVSHNNLTGEISSTICNMSSLQYLILANNSFTGMIPECLRNYDALEVLDLSMNNFHGSIPQIFRSFSILKTINLNGNQLEGSLPTSLANCSSLEVLNVGNNRISDTFPLWLATLPELQVLILRSNRFLGYIGNSETRFPFVKLRILDIANNSFTGFLPTKLFTSFKTMMHGHEKNTSLDYMGSVYYQDSVVLTWKGIDRSFERILTILSTIDLSSNQFQGKIPQVVGKLKSLKVFNVSHNHLMGQIPSSLRNLTELESLDLSSNKLTGNIPMQLTSLTFLSVLNISYNQLVGPIPQENQFNFDNNSYIGNLGLCGPPLSKKCVNDEPPQLVQPDEEEDTWSWFDWKVIMMGYGSGLVIGLSMGYMVFSTGKPHWFVKIFYRDRRRKVRKISRSHQRRN